MDNLLEEEQETVLASLSQLLPGLSSQETFLNPEEAEKVRNEGEMTKIGEEVDRKYVKRSNPRRRKKNRCPFTNVKRKRGRPRKKSATVKKPSATGKEENDSGFGTSSEFLKYIAPTADETHFSNSEDSVTSLESVSLLQVANPTAMEVDDASEGVKLAWNVKIFPALDDDEDDRKTTTDKAVQTGDVSPADGSIMQTVRFISSVIRLKQIFTSRTNISRKEFEKILKRLPEETESQPDEESSDDSDEMEVAEEDGTSLIAVKRRKDLVSCETVRYVMRKTNAEDVTEKSVDAILVWLKEETEKDWRTVCCCWNGSVTSEAVDIINEVVDSDVIGSRKKVSDFLAGILNEIQKGEDEQDTLQEFKVAFLSNFCKSILLQYDLITHVSKQLSEVVSSVWVQPQHEISTAKKIYFTLRLLENLLRSFLTALNTNQIEEIFRMRPKHEDEGVLNMWKTNWKRDTTISDDMSHHHHSKYLKVIRGWCSVTDAILNFSLKECLLLSLVAQRCSSLSREVLSKIETVSDEKTTA